MSSALIIGGGIFALIVAGLVGWLFISFLFREVVHPNEVHIVQSRGKKLSYGVTNRETGESQNGNAYHRWPEWWPVIGVTVTKLPLSVFEIPLDRYLGYDKMKVPFVIDIMAFFRIYNPNLAAERIEDFPELKGQMVAILKGAARTLLATYTVEEIMMERQVFGETFTKEVTDQLKEWGVEPVKNIELMDIRDPEDGSSQVIGNIQAKEQSRIEKESRETVAQNFRDAEQKEIEAKRDVDVAAEQAQQQVGEREAEKIKAIGIANEQAQQEIKEQAKVTAEKDMAVKKVEEVRQAEIHRDVHVVKAEEDKQVTVVNSEAAREQQRIVAEGYKDEQVLRSEGDLVDKQNEAKGIQAVGEAEAEAKRLNEMATVTPQIELAREIGENDGYQSYLVNVETVHANRDVGIEAAKALSAADLKVIANTGEVTSGVNNIMDVFSPKGGTALGGMLDALANTEQGQALVARVTGAGDDSDEPKAA